MEERDSRRIQFGVFEVDLVVGELRKSGLPVRLQGQPFRILKSLVERPGETVTREELRKEVWGDDVYVDFDRSLNTAVARLREALGDSPTRPSYIETVPRTGYRFIAQVGGAPADRLDPALPASVQTARRHRTAWIVVVVLAAAAAVSAAFWLRAGEQEPASPQQPIALTTYPGVETEPAFSPEGNQVAFSWTGPDDDNADIYVQVVGTTNPLRLTSDPAEDTAPAWSPDGRTIAFVRGGMKVHLIPALGGPERKLTEFNDTRASALVRLEWSPDGEWIASHDRASASGPVSLVLISTRSGEKRRWIDPDPDSFGDFDPAFSPDGRRLAFSRAQAIGVGYLHVVDLAEDLSPLGEPVKLTTQRRPRHRPVWTPDGQAIVFQSRPFQGGPLWRIRADELAEAELLPFGSTNSSPAISPSGNLLAFASLLKDRNIWRLDLSARPGQDSRTTRLIASTKDDWNAAYSPDGSRIAFDSNRGVLPGLWVCDADGRNARQLTFQHGGTPRWSPDGKWIAFDARTDGALDSEGSGDIWIIASEGGEPRLLTDNRASDIVPSWSRDGKWVYFGSKRSGDFQIWKQRPEGGEAIQVTRNGGLHAVESPSGRWLYFNKPGSGLTSSLWRMSTQGGPEQKVVDSTWGFAGFAPVEDGAYFLQEDRGSTLAIRFHRLADGSTETLLRSETLIGVITLSQDGRYLLYQQNDLSGSDLMLVENYK